MSLTHVGLTEPKTLAGPIEPGSRGCEPVPMILSTPVSSPITAAVRRAGAWLPRGWADLFRQLLVFAVLDVVYETSRMLAVGDRGVAMRHARDIVSAERSLGLFHELSVQHFAATDAPAQSIANWTYFNCQFTISFGFLLWVYLRRNDAFPRVRNVFLTANAIGVACYMLYPAAPPRMLTGLGFVDTLNETSVNHHSGVIASLANPYAAMPSLHTAYALIVATSAVMLVRTRALRVAWAFYPALVVFSIVATANHFFLDAAGGAGVAVTAALAVHAARTRSLRLAAALVAAPAAVFLAYRLAGRTGDAVGALAAVSLGTLALAALANLASVWLKAAVWRRTIDVVPGGPRLTTRQLLPSVFVGLLANSVLIAHLGEVAKVAVVTRRIRRHGSDLPVAAIVGTLIAEQLVLGAALVILGAALALTMVGLPASTGSDLVVLAAVIAAAAALGALAARTGLRPPAVVCRAFRPVAELVRAPRALAAALVLGLASWAAQILGIYWTLAAFHLPHSTASASAVFLVSTLVGLFPLMPGNVGVFQLAVAGVLASSFGVAVGSAAAFAVGLQASELLIGAGLGAVFLVTEGVSFAELRRSPAAQPAPADDVCLAYAA
jgi:uncharacterized membrane protein YbhN (UPF0104 family)